MATRDATRIERSEPQADAPRLAMSLAAFVLVCFFLPWLQVSCFGMQETASCYNLAREGERELWLAPLAMLLVLLAGLVYSVRRSTLAVFAGIVMVVFLAVYIAADPEVYRRGLLALVPPPRRERIAGLLHDLATTLRTWFATQLIAMAQWLQYSSSTASTEFSRLPKLFMKLAIAALR